METPTLNIKRIRQIAKKAKADAEKAKKEAQKQAELQAQQAADKIIQTIQIKAEYAAKNLAKTCEVMRLDASSFENYTWGGIEKLQGTAAIVANFLKKSSVKPYIVNSNGMLCFDFAD